MTIEVRQKTKEATLEQAKETIEHLKRQGFTNEHLKTQLFGEYEIRYRHPSEVPQDSCSR